MTQVREEIAQREARAKAKEAETREKGKQVPKAAVTTVEGITSKVSAPKSAKDSQPERPSH